MKETLTEGIYIIPDGYRAIQWGNEVAIVPRKSNKLPAGEYRCRDCKYRQEGYVSINAYHKSWICVMRPKQIVDERYRKQKIFYHAPYYGMTCNNFKLKDIDR